MKINMRKCIFALSLINLFIYTLFKVDLHITLQQKPIDVNYQNLIRNMYLLYKHRAVNKNM